MNSALLCLKELKLKFTINIKNTYSNSTLVTEWSIKTC